MGRTKPRYRKTERIYRLISLLSPLLLLLCWEGLVRVKLLDYRFFPPPSTVFVIFGRMIHNGEFWQHLSISLWRVLAGFAVGAIPAVVLGCSWAGFAPSMPFLIR